VKQPVIIKIGYHQFLLPDDVGAATVVKCLSRGVQCSYYGGKEIKLDDERETEVSLQYVPKNAQVVDAQGQPLQPKTPPNALRKLKPQHVPALKWNGDSRLL
jgi:hypothetical protein